MILIKDEEWVHIKDEEWEHNTSICLPKYWKQRSKYKNTEDLSEHRNIWYINISEIQLFWKNEYSHI